ncbi:MULTISPECIES: DUF3077 domain-containing protein [Pseudomonas]|uniref:DUF3077 domain-containing protein n=1 Tax=Pseudomonas TaxID=286 RepID=UPI0003FA1E15|nr:MULTISPECIES: DUF3077 domain-containing protein [Pseudomonas]MBK4990020.1 DUF3077 domain-containing protein [Pseudomonas sp. S36]
MDRETLTPTGNPNVLHAAGRFAPSDNELVHMKAKLPMRTALMEASGIMGCVTELTRKAIDRPEDRKVMMQATYYLAGMAKALIDGQVQQLRQAREEQGGT